MIHHPPHSSTYATPRELIRHREPSGFIPHPVN
jgi:hypothetical protein